MPTHHALIESALHRYNTVFDRLHEVITRERTFALFQQIADAYAPTLTARHARGPVVQQWLSAMQQAGSCSQQIHLDLNFRRTGNVVLSLGQSAAKPVWAMAHLDMISFLTGPYANGRYPLTPYCEARQTSGRRAALALDYGQNPAGEIVESGWLSSTPQGHFFETDNAALAPATRIVYASQAHWDQASGMVYGTIDNAAGCTSLLMAAAVLSHFDVEALIVLTDEEEGVVAAGPQAFSRGSARLLQHTPADELPDLITVTDQHEDVAEIFDGELDLTRFGQGANFGAFASGAKGGVTPPRLLAFQRQLSTYLAQRSVSLHENPGYVSRSDCVSAVMATPNVALLGFPAAYTHFIDTPRCHIDDLVNLAKSLAVYILVAQDAEWRAAYL
ncbi:MAG: M28 family peptidase [Caldilineaceae bacterium]|nr:M28 family peptidase [Caldilineaceae bacterium]